jgi:DNA replication protein DnaC
MIQRIKDVICELERQGYKLKEEENIVIDNAHEKIETIGKILLENFVMLEEYKHIADFFQKGTNGRSLALIGGCGTGKTFFLTKIMPVLLKLERNKHCTIIKATELADNLHGYMRQNYLVVDDIGTEEDANNFGNKKHQFAEWVNSVEYRDCFSAISTNLNGEQIKQKYDQRTYDRIKGNFKVILFKNQSFRKQ